MKIEETINAKGCSTARAGRFFDTHNKIERKLNG
jgi:hypothetical protein